MAARIGRIAMADAGRRKFLRAAAFCVSALALSACGGLNPRDFFTDEPPPAVPQQAQPLPPAAPGQVRAALILPLSAGGNAGIAGQSMKNAADMALAEFQNPNLQLLVKDDAGTQQGAQAAVQQALAEGAEIILGPLFAQSVPAVAQLARARNVPVIAFSTDANVAGRGVYLLSFLPESDVTRIVDHAVSGGRRSVIAMIPDNAYGSVVEAALRQATSRRGMRLAALERYDANSLQTAARNAAQAAATADTVFLPDSGEGAPQAAQALTAAGVNVRPKQLLGTGIWDDPRIFNDASMQGGLYAAPDPAGFRNFATRYRSRFGQDPARTATLAYDAVALVAALVRTQGPQRFSNETLTNSSGFTGIEGLFRFRADGTTDRGLAVLRVTPQGGQVAAPPPRAFGGN